MHDFTGVFHFDAYDDSMIAPSSIICCVGKLYAFCDFKDVYSAFDGITTVSHILGKSVDTMVRYA
jgi:hypothetical protein